MFCIECGNPLPDIRDNSTICSKCKTPLATWWDESSQAFRTNRESILPTPYQISSTENGGKMAVRKNDQTIEERSFQGALICLDGHFMKLPGFGDRTLPECRAMIKSALDASLNKSEVRYDSIRFHC
jgi:palmitoyltransferase